MKILYLPNAYSQQRQHEKPSNIYPVLMAMEAEWYRRQRHEVYWNPGRFPYSIECFDKVITKPEGLPFLSLPHPDRVFTRAKEYTSGNYKYLPGTHIMSASGCWHGECSFCVERGRPYEVRPVEDVISEIEEIKVLGFREVFDDSATFPTGRWLDEFLKILSNRKLNITLGCNLRIANLPFLDMRRANFRMVLFGVESANQKTLDKINKGVNVEDIIPTIKKASEAGLEPHIAVMFGYSWETDKEAENTLNLVYYLLRKGYAKTAQASFFTTKDELSNETQRHYVKQIYRASYSPEFWFNQLKDIKDVDDIKYLWRKIKVGLKEGL